LLERHHRGEPLGVVNEIGRPTRQGATRGTWQIALAGQSLAHMSYREKLGFSGAFGDFDLWDRTLAADGQSWLRLALLDNADLLTEQDWSEIRAAYAEAAYHNQHLKVLAPWLISDVTGLLPAIRERGRAGDLSAFNGITDQICKPMLASSASANTR
jgi:hypothetical protein